MQRSSRVLAAAAVITAGVAVTSVSSSNEGFGTHAKPLTSKEMASSTGGVAVTVIKPTPTQTHYIDNPQLDVDVINAQYQTTSSIYLYHGTSKTGSRSIATPAPAYAGDLQSRFMLRGGVDDLVIKYRDASSNVEYVSTQVASQRLHRDVKLYRVVVHNVTTTSNSTNVSREVIARAVDSKTYNQDLWVSDSIDTILANCWKRRRIQFTQGGMDGGGVLHRITTGTTKCANLENHITVDQQTENAVHNTTSLACMAELLAGSLAMDPQHESYHVFIVNDLPGGLNGFNSPEAQGAVIRKSEFTASPQWIATLLLHEIGHGFGLGHRATTDPDCSNSWPHGRALMCPGSQAGKLLSASECNAFYANNTTWLKDYN